MTVDNPIPPWQRRLTPIWTPDDYAEAAIEAAQADVDRAFMGSIVGQARDAADAAHTLAARARALAKAAHPATVSKAPRGSGIIRRAALGDRISPEQFADPPDLYANSDVCPVIDLATRRRVR